VHVIICILNFFKIVNFIYIKKYWELFFNVWIFLNFSAGGLVTAVAPVVIQGNGLWIGWAGVHLEEGEKIPESDPNDTTPTAGLCSDKVSYQLSKIKL